MQSNFSNISETATKQCKAKQNNKIIDLQLIYKLM